MVQQTKRGWIYSSILANFTMRSTSETRNKNKLGIPRDLQHYLLRFLVLIPLKQLLVLMISSFSASNTTVPTPYILDLKCIRTLPDWEREWRHRYVSELSSSTPRRGWSRRPSPPGIKETQTISFQNNHFLLFDTNYKLNAKQSYY